jgi:hypothetical protein
MKRSCSGLVALMLFVAAGSARAAEETTPTVPAVPRDDLFPRPGHLSVAAASGLPFLGIAEVGVGVSNGFAIGAVGGITPGMWTLGLRPRGRVRLNERSALVLVAPMLFYPPATGADEVLFHGTAWVLTRPELTFDRAVGERWHVAGGMGIIAAAGTKPIHELLAGRSFAMPAYDGNPQATRGFAGGIWNTIAARSSFALGDSTHLFAEASLVMSGVVPATHLPGPPILVALGAQHAF